jgi:signal transduction histidine kinase
MGSNKLAVQKYLLAVPVLVKNGIYSELALTYSNLASCYLDVPDNLKSIDAARKALFYSKKANIDYFNGAIYLNLASAYMKLAKIDQAVLYADSANEILAGSIDLEMGANKYKLLAEIYNKAKIYDKALKCLISYDSLNIIQSDSLINSLSTAELKSEVLDDKNLEIQNLKDLQKKQIQLQSAQRRILILTVGVSIFLLLLVLLLFMFINRTTKATKDLNEKNAIINQQFDELQRQNGVQLMTIGIVGHDLRGPLSTIVRLKESMISLGTQGRIKELEEVLEAVFSNLEKILGLSNNLVDWVLSSQSGIQFKFEEVKMQAVADSIKDAFILSLQEKNLTLTLDIAENASAYADLECVKTICRNLIQNAIKFTPENKQISLSAKLVKGISNQYVQIEIADEGIGIAPRILEKIKAGKNTFSSGTKGEKGSGLGLIMVQALLSMNKGTMEIVTEVGKGTTFELLIPAFNPEYAKQQIKK